MYRPEQIQVAVLERGQAGVVLLLKIVAFGAELGDGGVDVLRGPEHDGVEDQAERGELVLHPVAVRLVDGAALAVAHVAGQPRAAALTSRVGVRAVLTPGLALLAMGMLVLARTPIDGGLLDVLPGMLLLAIGSSLAYAPTFIAASTGVPADHHGAASGLINSTQELGTAACLALLVFVATGATTENAINIEDLADRYQVGLIGAAILLTAATFVAAAIPRSLGREPATCIHRTT